MLTNWIHRLLNPHCEHCLRERELEREERKENKICESCETLKKQLEIANHNNDRLMARLLDKPEPIVNQAPVEISRPKTIPWRVKQQMLEAEDRQRAIALRSAGKPDAPAPSTEELEKELGVEDALRSSNAQV